MARQTVEWHVMTTKRCVLPWTPLWSLARNYRVDGCSISASTRATTIRSSMMLLRIRRPYQPPRNDTPQEEAWRKSAPLGCRAHSQLDQPFQTTTRSVGKEGWELRSFSRARVCATHLFEARSRFRI